jgi:hypothetical protein
VVFGESVIGDPVQVASPGPSFMSRRVGALIAPAQLFMHFAQLSACEAAFVEGDMTRRASYSAINHA